MRTAGIDLSTRPRKTAVAVIDWGEDSAAVVDLSVGGHDVPALCYVIEAVDKTGDDCPFGWPNRSSTSSRHIATAAVRMCPVTSMAAVSLRTKDPSLTWTGRSPRSVEPQAIVTDHMGATATL
ncbi:DUF429 domain-containing protein [Janibacter sp. YB324]|uniref:DUF429 domain-containing protein n=1 Tax=Janibacter sp. YB324 TaxID=2761047 RepID=UPI0016265080|nr:DUF429 domain-containing protein [Janibacter sp. YB324]QNF95365.1 DUF429 domain-containing protein [Janibacter sp. YB324]